MPERVPSRFADPADREAQALRRLRAACRLAEARLDDFEQLTRDWFWETDASHALTYLSPRARKLLALGLAAPPGAGFSALAVQAASAHRLEARLRTRHAFCDVALRLRLDGGHGTKEAEFLISGQPLLGADGKSFLGFRGIARRPEYISSREAALQHALEEAEAKSRAKSDFLAGMSHELRTPLNAIIGFSEVMRDETFGPIGSRRYQDYAGDVHDSARHLLGLINDMLDLAKVEAGKLVLHEEPIDPADLMHTVLRLVAPLEEREGPRIETLIGEGLPPITGDERKLKQVLLNLLSNAIKFTPAGGCVTVAVEQEARGGIAFVVRDGGVGMSDADIVVALSPFGQVVKQGRPLREGTGLGLPLSKALAELHGGALELESAPGRGTTATLRLPAWRVVAG